MAEQPASPGYQPDQGYQEMVENALEATAARLVVLSRFDAERQEARVEAWAARHSKLAARAFAAVRRIDAAFDPSRVAVRADVNALARATYLDGRPVSATFDEVAQHTVDARIVGVAKAVLGLRHAFLCPLRTGAGVAGSLGFYSPKALTDGQRCTAEAFSRQAALTLENARLLEALRELDRLKSDLLATISHELRTPLTIVHGYAQRLKARAGADDAAAVEAIAERILAGSTQLTHLVEDLVDFGRMERGEVRVDPQTVDLVPTLRDVVAAFQSREGGARLEAFLPAALPARADPARVAQAVANLVENAVKYAPKERIVVRAAPAAGMVRVEVADQGPGIPPKEQPRVWEKFYRGSSTAALNRARGAGIGLAVVKALVEAQGGRVGLTSVPGRGACFWFELPASGGAASGPTGSAASSQQPAG